MKKILFLALILLASVSCKKDKDSKDNPTEPTIDVREAFVGEYELAIDAVLFLQTSNETVSALIPDSFPVQRSFSLTIAKDPEKDNQVIVSGFYNCTALVSGNNLILESSTENVTIKPSDFIQVDFLDGITLPVTYSLVHKTATLQDGIMTWHSDATGSASTNIQIVIPITLDITGSAKIENTAYKL
ncbi:MAG: hypothetical protein MJ002_04215 [Paludibacteraceae bacterium]|nr:hypothetical protein [Paludibacteraceae bacterium]